jgi:hypothetical protein
MLVAPFPVSFWLSRIKKATSGFLNGQFDSVAPNRGIQEARP